MMTSLQSTSCGEKLVEGRWDGGTEPGCSIFSSSRSLWQESEHPPVHISCYPFLYV